MSDLNRGSKVIVHHLQDSRSQRIIWLLEELEVPYEVKQYKRVKGRAPAELEKINPLGKSPVISDGDVVVAESGAIVEYIIGRYDGARKLQPQSDSQSDADRRAYTFWLHFAEGSMMHTLVMKVVFATAAAQTSVLVRPILNAVSKQFDAQYMDPECKKNYDYIESQLARSEWFAGEKFTAADIQMSFPMELAMRGGCTKETHPKIFAWREKAGAMASYKRALEAGTRNGMKYEYAL